MATPTVTFRLLERERQTLDKLAEELVCSRTDVIRAGLRLLRKDDAFRKELKAVNLVKAFLGRLEEKYGPHADLRFEMPTASCKIGGKETDEVDVRVRYEEPGTAGSPANSTRRTAHFDLIDPQTGVGLFNAYVTSADEENLVVIPLSAIYVPSPAPSVDERTSWRLPDGRMAVEVIGDDGSARRYVIDADGTSALLNEDAHADWIAE